MSAQPEIAPRHSPLGLHHQAFLVTLRATGGRIPRRCMYGLLGVGFEELAAVGCIRLNDSSDGGMLVGSVPNDPFLQAIVRSLPRRAMDGVKLSALVRRSVFGVGHRTTRLIGRDLAARSLVTIESGRVDGFLRGCRFRECDAGRVNAVVDSIRTVLKERLSEAVETPRREQVLAAYASDLGLIDGLFGHGSRSNEISAGRLSADELAPNLARVALRVGASELGWMKSPRAHR